MVPRLRRALVVILATSHSPAVISPEWLRESGLIQEPATQFVNSPQFSVFESESFALIVDDQRLQLTARKQDTESLEEIQRIAAKYVRLFPHISYRALGLNFVWLLEAAIGESVPQIGVTIGTIDDLSGVFTDHQLAYGSIIYAERDPYRLRLMVEPEGANTLVCNFNYHHNVEGFPAARVAERVEAFLQLWEHSRTVAATVCAAGG